MNKVKYISIAIVTLAVIIAVLLYNKAQITAEARNEKITAYPVNITKVTERQVSSTLDIVGTIAANNDVLIVSEAQGEVKKILAEVGDYKPAGSVLIQIDDELKQAALKTAQVNLEKSKKDYERFQALYKEKSATDAQLEAAKLAYQAADAQFIVARRQYNDTKITAPISGIVTMRAVNIGDYVKNRQVVAEVIDISTLKVKLNVDEEEVFKLKVGDKVDITTDIYPGVVFYGKIKTIGAKGDAAHTYPVEIDLPNSKKHPLKAGMFARVTFTITSPGKSLFIPRESLVGSVLNPKVFVVKNGSVKLKNIVIGSTYNNYLQVLNGLKDGETVVVNGQNNLKDDDKVLVVN